MIIDKSCRNPSFKNRRKISVIELYDNIPLNYQTNY